MSRRRRVVENDEYAAFVERAVKSLARRAADDPEALAQLARIADVVNSGVRQAARSAHDQGYSWAEIAATIGVTRQAAHQRFSRQGDVDTESASVRGAAWPTSAAR